MKQLFFACALAGTVACGGNDPGSEPVDAAVAIDASPDAFVQPFTLTGTVTEPGTGGSTGAAIANASQCMMGLATNPCTQTGGDGSYSLVVTPSLANVTELTTANGHLGAVFLAGWKPDEGVWSSDIVLQPDDAATTLLHTQAGFVFPTTDTGFVEIFVGNGTAGMAAVGATATLAPASGNPVYLDANGIPDPTLTAVTSSGRVLWGNLAPGTYEITVTNAGTTCAANNGGFVPPITRGFFAPTGTATAGVAVVAAALTSSVDVVCR